MNALNNAGGCGGEGKAAPVPNEHGVYAKEDGEVIRWPGSKNYLLYVEISVLSVDGVWLSAADYTVGNGGGGEPLMKRHREPDFTSRAAAIAHAAGGLIRRLERNDDRHAAAVREWLESLTVAPAQLDMFSEAA
ncbi:hypothetical protein [Sphingobium sp. WCS2017Hpa-17]|uniref:hypothetical protein n=1 Tax=Sphingobium sp. WCS2017Hpa-17 TaxID=3073638 RepID=UPI00288AF05C|nr:hypothetical protein [Sphingobium sp. WCS2017Hpa-17]